MPAFPFPDTDPAPTAESAARVDLTSRLPVVTRPRLHRGHFAYLRAVVQGVAPRRAWARYLPEEAGVGDRDEAEDAGQAEDRTARVHRMTGWIRAELCAAAARGGQFGRATLLRLDLAPLGSALPTLETFVAAQGLEEFSEAEQLADYEAAFGTALAQQGRRTALLRRQLLAIHALEATMAVPVRLDDGCEAWLTDAIAARLAAHGLRTLADLHARVAGDAHWWRTVPGVGAGKAAAIRQFLAAHAGTLGALPDLDVAGPVPTGAQTTSHTAPSRAAPPGPAPLAPSPFVPVERLVLPPDLDGRTGRFRASRDLCLIDADDDRQAILTWLAVKAPPVAAPPGEPPRPSHTLLAYRKEAERLLLWCALERRRPLSSLTAEDTVAYQAFPLAPPVHWCGPRNVPRWHVGWHPFEAGLSARSAAYAIAVLGNLFAFLVSQNYLVGNPFRAVRVPVRLPRGPDPGRGLSQELWQHVVAALDALPRCLASLRLQVALHLLHAGGLRLAELVAARTDDLEYVVLRQADGTSVAGWLLRTVGKGGKTRLVPVPDAWLQRLGHYLVARGLPADPRQARGVPLLGVVRGGAAADAGVTGSAVHGQLKRFFLVCAARLEATDPVVADRLRQASCHWLRHTHINHSLDHGVPVEIIQQNVGHASLGTTTIYVRSEDARRLDAMQQMWRQRGPAERA
ncbi:phage integrase family protein [Cupriavidus sp. CuC1]|uniref:phage integrase family protein n=1 Tax=Cupriavidus sp. CuC1 TaxID=3373131 RepID=UPI0037D706C8